jgi:ABC-2 type transport system permease protein
MTYFFIVQIISSFIFVRVGFNIAHDIYRGDFANYLVRPFNYLVFRFVHEMSRNLFRTLISLVLLGGLLILFLDIPHFPAWKIGLSLLMLPIGYTINFALVCSIALLAFWVTNSTRFMFIYFGILTIFSGMMFPLDLFPGRLYDILAKLPFAYIFYFPAKILWSNTYDPDFIEALDTGLLYTTGLLLLLSLVYWRGVKKFEAVGR